MKNKHKKMTEQEYQQIKVLLSYNLRVVQICKVTERSWNTIAAVRDSEDLKDYFAKSAALHETKKPKPVINITTEVGTDDLKANIDKLTDIMSNLLTRVYDLEQANKKRESAQQLSQQVKKGFFR